MPPKNRRKSRPKARRALKYLSLRRHLTPVTADVRISKDEEKSKLIDSSSSSAIADLDRDLNVSCLLDGASGGVGEVPTLDDLLGNEFVVPESSGSASSINWGGDDEDVLARKALRGRERWVYCEEEVASSGDGWWCGVSRVGLALKLDHERILSEWSDRGSLYIDGEAPVFVPQVPLNPGIPVLVEVECGGGDKKALDGDRTVVIEGVSREERVMRYKEKRRNRLFAKRIRYEVRKINAEKRPRWKGRFIKRLEDDNEDLS